MRSDVVDQLVGTYLKQPVKASWEGTAADLLRGSFDDPRIELGGIATAWLPLEGVVISARRAEIVPGVPPVIRLEEPSVSAVVGQRDVTRWVERFQLPFELHLTERGLLAKAHVAGLRLAEIEVRIDIVGGWFVLKPGRASLLGIPNYAAWLFRTFLPLPPLAEGASLEEIGHEPGQLRLRVEIDTFEEELTPGLLKRLRGRVLP